MSVSDNYPTYPEGVRDAFLDMVSRVKENNRLFWLGKVPRVMADMENKSISDINVFSLAHYCRKHNVLASCWGSSAAGAGRGGSVLPVCVRGDGGADDRLFAQPSRTRTDASLEALATEKRRLQTRLLHEMRQRGITPSREDLVCSYLYNRVLGYLNQKYNLVNAPTYTGLKFIAEMASTLLAYNMGMHKMPERENVRHIDSWLKDIDSGRIDMAESIWLIDNTRERITHELTGMFMIKENFFRSIDDYMKSKINFEVGRSLSSSFPENGIGQGGLHR